MPKDMYYPPEHPDNAPGAPSKGSAHRPMTNPERVAAYNEIRRSSKAGPHVPAPRKGTRAQKKRRAIDEG